MLTRNGETATATEWWKPGIIHLRLTAISSFHYSAKSDFIVHCNSRQRSVEVEDEYFSLLR